MAVRTPLSERAKESTSASTSRVYSSGRSVNGGLWQTNARELYAKVFGACREDASILLCTL
uniref:Uncharacterized protein n=1 Tax=Hyaloperonospora arabidopsidis (strain Emoy2) TaxID=559515 RepID=M4BS33_HYAAE